MNKKVIDALLLMFIPVFTFLFFTYALERGDTILHEEIHADVCKKFYNGTPEVVIHFAGGGLTRCWNATNIMNSDGRLLDVQNEITGYNISSIRIGIALILTFISILISVIITREDD
jgi:hypothetical protein